jgi:hypothetical protein
MMRFLQSFLVFLLLSTLATTTRPASADDFLGGPGGSDFAPVNCAPDKVVIGLAGRAGAVIDTMQVLCGQANGNDNDQPIPTPSIGPSNGGSAASAVCPPLTAAIAIQVNKKMWQGHFAVSQIKLTCVFPGDGSVQSFPVFGYDDGIGSIPAGSKQCPEHQLIGGISGRYGTWIDAVGTNCVPVSVLQDRDQK